MSLITPLTINGSKIFFKELKLKEYKTILKCLIGTPPDATNLILNINSILQKITNLNKNDILKLNIFEYFLLITNIRIMSLGDTIFAVSRQNDSSINIQISLNKTVNVLEEIIKNIKDITLTKDDITFQCTVPTVQDILENKEPLNIFINSKQIPQDDLPVRYLSDINLIFAKLEQQVKTYYFFKASNEKYSLRFSTKPIEYISLLKILLNENLLSVYDSIFYLCKTCNFSAEYLENCTYGEFQIFIKKAEAFFAQSRIQINEDDDTIEKPEFEPVDMETLYGHNTNDLQVSRSEFTP